MTVNWLRLRSAMACLLRTTCRIMPRSDLSLTRAHCGRWLFHAILLSTLLAHMASLGALSLHGYSRRWQNAISNQATILIAPLADDVSAGKVPALARRTAQTLDILKAIPDISRISRLDDSQVADIVQPWLGLNGTDGQIPLPAVIDFQVSQQLAAQPSRLDEALHDVQGLSIDLHAAWIGKARSVFRTLQIALLTSLVLLGLAIGTLMVVVTRAAIAISQKDMATLLTCGATDWYIMRQILLQAGIIALRAGGTASLLFLPAGIAAHLLMASSVAPTAHFGLLLTGQLFLIPVLVSLLCAATAAATTFAFLKAPEA